jgi:rifampicin phosphotransferase
MKAADLQELSALTNLHQFVRPLSDAFDEHEAGGKAHNLARLIALGAPVPDGVVITNVAFRRFLQLNRLRAQLEPLCLELDPSNPDRLRGVSHGIRELLMSTPFPPELQKATQKIAADLLPGSALAVRSSAIGEDGSKASFAGQFDSILNVQTQAELENALRACWASYWSERALFYQASRGSATGGMAIVVQRQVAARFSGVLFTCSPGGISGAQPDDIVIEHCAGLGDALVSGHIDPCRTVVSRADLSITNVTGPADLIANHIFLKDRIVQLASLAMRLEREFGSPQDIEWAIDHEGEIWILQSRPVTTLGSTGPTVFWSNANVNENFPQPISPLLYSIASVGYYHYFRNLALAFGLSHRRVDRMERPLTGIIGVHGARMYYNLTNIHAVLQMAPCGKRLTSAFNQFVGADQITAPSAKEPRASYLEILRMGAKISWQYLFLRRRIECFEKTIDEYAADTRADRLSRRSMEDLLADLHSFTDIRCHRWKDASLADAASMVCYALLQHSLKDTGGDLSLHNRLLRALPDMPSSVPPLRLWELSRMIRSSKELCSIFETADAAEVLGAIRHDGRFAEFRQAFEQFLEDWGFRSSAELMLTVPSLQENPIPAIELLKVYAMSDGEPPEAAMSRQAAERLTETRRTLRKLRRRSPLKAIWVWLILRCTQHAVTYRERARLKQALLYGRLRLVALAIGDHLLQNGLLRERDEIFMFTWQEILELGEGRAMFPYQVTELIAQRRREHEKLAAMHPPDTIRLHKGHYFPPNHSSECKPLSATPEVPTILRGIGASGGLVTARAAVLADVREAHRLQQGDVLVTRQTDPGWAPVFGLISGLVIERGGMLSHGAIIAREFGLPCVVGIQCATQCISHGSVVTVDGDRGTCAIQRGHDGDDL